MYRLTPVKCPHLLSHETTGQVDSGALDQVLSLPHVVSHPAVVTSCSAELCFVLGKDGLRYRLRTPCNSEHSVFIGQHSNKRTTYHSATKLVSRHTSHTVHEEIGTTFNAGLSTPSRVQFASGTYIAYLAGKLLHVMDVYVVFHVQVEVLLANGTGLPLYGICDTVQANRGIWHTSQQRDKGVGFQFPLIISALAPQYTNCSVLSCHVHQLRGVTRCASRERSSSDAKASLPTAAFTHRSRSSRSDIGVPS